jgi:hypothetical protein
MTGEYASWKVGGNNPPISIPGFLQGVVAVGPITVATSQSIHVSGSASITNQERLAGPLFFVIYYAPADTPWDGPTAVGQELEQDFIGDIPTFHVSTTALIQNLPPGKYYVGLAARVPPGALGNMLTAVGGSATALIF